MTSEEVAALRAALAKMTERRWCVEEFASVADAREDGSFQWCHPMSSGAFEGKAVGVVWADLGEGTTTGIPGSVELLLDDALGIVALRNAAPRLLDEVDRLTKRVAKLENALYQAHTKFAELDAEENDCLCDFCMDYPRIKEQR